MAIASTYSVHGDWDTAGRYHRIATEAGKHCYAKGHPVVATLLAYHAEICLYTDQVMPPQTYTGPVSKIRNWG